MPRRRLLLFTKPAREGRVKTRLIGDLTAAEAAALHSAFLDDLVDRLRDGDFELQLAWALDADDELPAGGIRQQGDDLGERLYRALSEASRDGSSVMAVGSDHPTLRLAMIHEAFERLERGAEVVLGPAEDGGYYLIALRPDAVDPGLFRDIPWSTGRVLSETLERCRELAVELLPPASDVDTPEDLRRLAARLASDTGDDLGCPRTRELLRAWQRIPQNTGVGSG